MITELISSYLFPPLFHLLPLLLLLLLPLRLLFLFVITEKPITSMLRGLSAPVKMRFQQSDEDLALIMVSTLLCTVRHTTLQCTVRYRTLQCTSLHFIAIYCSVFKCDSIIELRLEYCYVGTLMQIDKRISHTYAYKHFLISGLWTVIYHIDTQRSGQLQPTRCEPIPLTTRHNTTNQIRTNHSIHNRTQHNTIEHNTSNHCIYNTTQHKTTQ